MEEEGRTWREVAQDKWRAILLWMARYADPFAKWAVVLAIVGGGWWLYTGPAGNDVVATNPQMQIAVDYLDLPEGDKKAGQYKIAVIHVKTKNLGTAAIEVSPDDLVLSLNPVQGELPAGWVDTRNLVAQDTVALLQKYPDGEILEAGVEYDDQAAFVLPVGAVFVARAKLDLGDNNLVQAESYLKVK